MAGPFSIGAAKMRYSTNDRYRISYERIPRALPHLHQQGDRRPSPEGLVDRSLQHPQGFAWHRRGGASGPRQRFGQVIASGSRCIAVEALESVIDLAACLAAPGPGPPRAVMEPVSLRRGHHSRDNVAACEGDPSPLSFRQQRRNRGDARSPLPADALESDPSRNLGNGLPGRTAAWRQVGPSKVCSLRKLVHSRAGHAACSHRQGSWVSSTRLPKSQDKTSMCASPWSEMVLSGIRSRRPLPTAA